MMERARHSRTSVGRPFVAACNLRAVYYYERSAPVEE